jgi:hypothetical protein
MLDRGEVREEALPGGVSGYRIAEQPSRPERERRRGRLQLVSRRWSAHPAACRTAAPTGASRRRGEPISSGPATEVCFRYVR